MRIALLTAGSRGDLQPFLALAAALEAQGATCTLAAPAEFAGLAASRGVAFHPTRASASELMKSGELSAARTDTPLRALSLLADPRFLERLIGMQEDFAAACEGAEAIVYHPGAAVGRTLARERGLPSVLASPFPFAATRDHPSLLFAEPRLPRLLNRTTHRLFREAFWMATKPSLERYLERTGRKGIRLENPMRAEGPKLVSCSPRVFPSAPGVPSFGYWFLEPAADAPLPAGLDAFLREGPPPLYIGFGSMGNGAETQRITDAVTGALQRTGDRAILATGSGGLVPPADLPDRIRVVESVDHDRVFPRCAAIVHHGGAGTTAEGFRAGVPMVLVPHGNDQPGWGRRVHELGTGPAPIPARALTAERLAAALEEARSPGVVAAARALGEGIRSEHGARDAAAWILERIG